MTRIARTGRTAPAAVVVALALTAAAPVGAQSASSSNAALRVPIPPTVITRQPPLSSVGAGGCAQQYTKAINDFNNQAIVANSTGLNSNYAGATATATSIVTQIAATSARSGEFGVMAGAFGVMAGFGAPSPFNAAGIPGTITAFGAATALATTSGLEIASWVAQGVAVASTVFGTASQQTALGYAGQAQALTDYVANLPNCDAEFNGTVSVSGGGVNVTGGSIFNNDVSFARNIHVEDNANARQAHTTEGISAHNGGIWIGNPDGTTYSPGITFGGGAMSGAGVGGALAVTGDVNATAIGNNAYALRSGSLALGLDSSSTGADAIAIGTAAAANGQRDVVVGTLNSTGAGGDNTVVGNRINILGDASVGNTVLGTGHQVTGSSNFVGGDPSLVVGSANVAMGANSTVTGASNVAIGETVSVRGNRAVAVGNSAVASAHDAIAVGTNAQANAQGSSALGQGAVANANDAIAVGTNAQANVQGSSAFGQGAVANASDAIAVGTNAQANALGSAAFGQGAVASLPQQQVFGTSASTYSMPGIPSDLTRSRQVGPLEVVTSDAQGNLATDSGVIYDALSQNQAGVAIALALPTPSLQNGERFGIALNWGTFEQSQAIGISVMGVVGRGVFTEGDRLALTGSYGGSIRSQSFGGRSTNSAQGGRAGVQLTW